MSQDAKSGILERLKHSVQLLASSPEIQLRLLPSFVCKADELALEFEQWHDMALHEYEKDFTAQQLSSLSALDGKLDSLTRGGKQHWTDEAVRTSPHWNEVRRLATQALGAFGWPAETPPSYASEYVSPERMRKHSVN